MKIASIAFFAVVLSMLAGCGGEIKSLDQQHDELVASMEEQKLEEKIETKDVWVVVNCHRQYAGSLEFLLVKAKNDPFRLIRVMNATGKELYAGKEVTLVQVNYTTNKYGASGTSYIVK